MATAEFIKEKWEDIKKAVRKQWPDRISDQELAKIVPDHAALCDLIGSSCELSKEQAKEEVDRLLDNVQNRGLPF